MKTQIAGELTHKQSPTGNIEVWRINSDEDCLCYFELSAFFEHKKIGEVFSFADAEEYGLEFSVEQQKLFKNNQFTLLDFQEEYDEDDDIWHAKIILQPLVDGIKTNKLEKVEKKNGFIFLKR